ncbi:uncharacterized [Tachysurus ichikawai]
MLYRMIEEKRDGKRKDVKRCLDLAATQGSLVIKASSRQNVLYCTKQLSRIVLNLPSGVWVAMRMKGWTDTGSCPDLICLIKEYDVILCGRPVAIPKRTMICCWGERLPLRFEDTIKMPAAIEEAFGSPSSSSRLEAKS